MAVKLVGAQGQLRPTFGWPLIAPSASREKTTVTTLKFTTFSLPSNFNPKKIHKTPWSTR